MSKFFSTLTKKVIETAAPHVRDSYFGNAVADALSPISQLKGDVLLQLGEYKFSVGTAAHQTIARKTDYRWSQLDRLNRRPAQQFLGIGAETVTLEGHFYPHFSGGYDQIDRMRQEAESGEPLFLVDQFGGIFGRFCVTHIEETGSILDHTGRPRRIDFSLSLIEYGEDLA